MSDNVPVIVVTRHPDWGNEIRLYEVDALVIDVDLGASFDAAKIGEADREDVADWAYGMRELVDALPADHPARADVRSTVREIVAERRSFDRREAT